jgi:hypothetical protein
VISRPRLAALVAIFIALGVGAFSLGAFVVPIPQTANVAQDSVALRSQQPSKQKSGPDPRASVASPAAPATPPPAAHSSAPAPTSPGPASAPISSVPAGNVSCGYRDDTWSSDASSVGYSVDETQATNGDLASYTVVLNADPGTTEVVGYPSDQCILYAALPSSLTSSFAITPPANSGGLDYEYAYDIWLTTAQAATSSNWSNDMELMVWTYVNGQVPSGSIVATLSDGSKVWFDGNNTSGTVSVVLPANESSGTINITSIISQLKALGYITTADDGILDVEYGIEPPYGGGQTFKVDGFSVTAG